MIDEMDLLGDLKAAEPMRPRALEDARAVLQAAMAVDAAPETRTAARRRARWGMRRTAGFSAAAVAAAAAAVALVVTLTPAPTHNAVATGKPPTQGAPLPANPALAQLAADITARPAKLPGNATLEIRNQSPASDKPGANGIDLYTDSGIYYWGLNRSNLRQAIAAHQDDGQGQFKRAMAAAVIAAKGDVATGRAKMAVANLVPGTSTGPGAKRAHIQAKRTEIQKLRAYDKEHGKKYTPPKPLTPAQKKEQTDNFIWMNALDALSAAPGNTQVRAGVLDIMATMPNVKVTHTSTAGRPTLTLADSWPLLDKNLVESLVIDASTGSPVALFNRQPGQPLNATYYHDSRVTLASVKSGKF
jgi:hypothetical protein